MPVFRIFYRSLQRPASWSRRQISRLPQKFVCGVSQSRQPQDFQRVLLQKGRHVRQVVSVQLQKTVTQGKHDQHLLLSIRCLIVVYLQRIGEFCNRTQKKNRLARYFVTLLIKTRARKVGLQSTSLLTVTTLATGNENFFSQKEFFQFLSQMMHVNKFTGMCFLTRLDT